MFRFINISKKLKKDVEEITCSDCKQAKLSFSSVEFDEDFEVKDIEELTVDTYCKACKIDSKVIVLFGE